MKIAGCKIIQVGPDFRCPNRTARVLSCVGPDDLSCSHRTHCAGADDTRSVGHLPLESQTAVAVDATHVKTAARCRHALSV